MTGAVVYLVLGLSLLLATLLPHITRRVALSPPMVLVGVGLAIGLLPMADDVNLRPEDNHALITHVTEFTVLVSLMGVGLAIDRILDVRSWRSWRTWSPVWRLLLVAMPLTILGTMLLGWWVAGLAPAVALLLGAVLAPTDPVLASDVQVGEPLTEDVAEAEAETEDEEEVEEDDDIRFSLTAEAGLNDGLAFPFVHLALLLLAGGFGLADVGTWLGWYVVGKIAVGLVVGVGAGWLFGRQAFHARNEKLRLADAGEPLLALAALLTSYGAAELVGGYGFLAVFACAVRLRSSSRGHSYQRAMHGVVERLERLMTLLVLLVLGMAMTQGLLEHLDWRGVVVALALVLVVRPLAGYLSLAVLARDEDEEGGLDRGELAAVAFFGVRGIGSLFYLGYAASHEHLPDEPWLWSTVAFTIIVSVLLHGVTATPAMARLDARREREAGTG
ncbi:sodium:proton antiporter [Nocardioides sp. zg-1308]|uniref:Cation:proton antiporter n=1 Tax=Nocardioides renjunii TaxID=3095075 RepID=A0ABU5K9R8_9ACTN|nr:MULTISPECIES: cation:proton antiporter [unclassified Nocardioides]MDZ5661195.1 cation:proton antiporter [Nocardioides sp. S-58]NPD04312.1 sodium:proton antiporter [Nocardioides sp. zg-1308]